MRRRTGHGILLGGIGGDSHSVGLHILHRALTSNGYRVCFLGTQNRIEELVRRAPEFDVVMISNMDGHAGHYLREFRRPAPPAGGRGPLWYLGGNLTIGDEEGCKELFEGLGFDRVYPKFVDLTTVLAALEQDLRNVEPAALHAPSSPASERLDDARFLALRNEVLSGWPTGEAARSLDDNAGFLGRAPSFPSLLAAAGAGRRPMVIQPRSGVPDVDAQIGQFLRFRDQGVPAVSFQVDSLTRNNNYEGAATAIAESARSGRAVLNGFPVVNHGVAEVRRVAGTVGLPLQTRHSTRDPRLLAEVSYAGGITGFEGGAICYNIPYYKDYPLRDAIAAWKYVDRLTGLYCERYGIVLDREFFGTLTATLLPPCIPLTTNIAEAVLAAAQGVRCVSLGYAEQGHRAQDIAAIRVQAELAREILDGLGFADVAVHTVFYQYMAAFPLSRQRSEELIFGSAVTAALAGATRMITKTPAESRKIPALEDNLRGLEVAQLGVEAAGRYRVQEEAVEAEARILRREVRALWESLMDAGRGDVEAGVVRGFEQGLLDIPFAPSVHNQGEVLTARDTSGAVRFLRTGNLRFDAEVRQLHEARMDERRRAEGLSTRDRDYILVEADVLRIARERHDAWPLDASAGDPVVRQIFPWQEIA